MNTAVNKQLVFGKLKMTVISELLRNENCHANHYSLCRAEGVRGAIYMVERTQEDKFILIGKGF
ncbi:hypothetical protein [Elizabethkingia miricola]|uniref:Uncharacterized protein n=1 Tax=Elizabethkingia miricola TaxID=172045 RepID=A0ABD5B4L9_ELIMR|nr:hypothetical protein [Elizabethkingia miricola]MDQ8748368.1 hypothetical protein [Elizabethkingia miricola]